MNWLKRRRGRLIFLTVLVIFSYFNSLNNEFVSDDIFAIVNNPNLGNWGEVFKNPFYFLRPLEYWVVFSLFGKNPMIFRLISLISHIFTVWGVYALVRLVSGGRSRGELTALIASVLFAVHPLGVEAVSWISAGGYVQAAAFGVWSLVFWVLTIYNNLRGSESRIRERFFDYAQNDNRKAKNYDNRRAKNYDNRKAKNYVWSLVLFLLALFSTEKSVVVVGLMFVLSFLWGDLKKDWKYLIAPVLLSLVWLGVSLAGIGVRQESLQVNYYNEPTKINFWLQLPVAISEYLKLFVWPVGLTLYHSDLFFNNWQFVLRVVVLALFLAGAAWAFFKNRKLFFWLWWFLICLSPTLLPLGLGWIVAERYVYMAMIGLCVMVAMGFEVLRKKWGSDGVNFVLVLLVGLLGLRTVVRNNDWQTADDLWFSAERYSTLSPQNHNNLGDAYGKRGRLELSRDHFLRAIELNPGYADAMHNLGNTYMQMGELEKARESYANALRVNPNLWQSEKALKAIGEYEMKHLIKKP